MDVMHQVRSGQAGAETDEIKITPQMIEAGALALEGSGAFEDRAMTASAYSSLAYAVIKAAFDSL